MSTRGNLRVYLSTQNLFIGLVILVISYLVLVPLGMLVYGSLSTAAPGKAGQLTFAHYLQAYGRTSTYKAFANSVVYAVGSSVLAFVFGTFLAWVSQRTNTPGKRLIFVGTLFPVFIPSVLMTVSWILLLSPEVGVLNKWWLMLSGADSPLFDVYTMGGMIWVGGILEIPLAFLWMWPAFSSMDPSLEEASQACGANTLETLCRVTLRLLTPAMVATWLIVFVRQLESFAVPGLLGMPKGIYVLATEIYLTTTKTPRNTNLASAYGVFLILITLVGIFFYLRATSLSSRYATITGKGFKPAIIDLGVWRYFTLLVSLLLVLLLVGLPLFALFFTSFLPFLQAPTLESLSRLTLDNYYEALNYDVAFRSFKHSILLGIGAGFLTMLLTLVAGWFVVRSQAPLRKAVDLIASLPVAMPGVVVGLSVMWVYLTVPIPIYGTLWILLVAYITRFLPYGMRIAYSSFSQIHKELEEASYASGGSWWNTFHRISVPLLAPAVFIGTFYIALRVIRELPTSIMLTHFGTEVFSVTIYDLWEGGYTGRLAAVGVLAIVVLCVVSLIVERLGEKWGLKP